MECPGERPPHLQRVPKTALRAHQEVPSGTFLATNPWKLTLPYLKILCSRIGLVTNCAPAQGLRVQNVARILPR